MGKSVRGQPTKPAEPSSEGFEGTLRRDSSITRDESDKRNRALAAINALVEPLGLSHWLTAERPDLIIRGQDLIRQIDAAWSSPLEEFVQALELFGAHHAECCRQFEEARTKPRHTLLEREQRLNEQPTKKSLDRGYTIPQPGKPEEQQ